MIDDQPALLALITVIKGLKRADVLDKAAIAIVNATLLSEASTLRERGRRVDSGLMRELADRLDGVAVEDDDAPPI